MIGCPSCNSRYAGGAKSRASWKFAPSSLAALPHGHLRWPGKVQSRCFEQLVGYEAGNFWVRARNALIVGC